MLQRLNGPARRYKALNKVDSLKQINGNEANLRRLVEQLKTGVGVVPFIGAGMSAPFGFPGWTAFLVKLAKSQGVKAKILRRLKLGEYEEAAEDLLGVMKHRAFDDEIEDNFGEHKLRGKDFKGAASYIPMLARGPVITTNFDRVLERVFETTGRRFERVILGAKPASVHKALQLSRNYLLKIHGDYEDRIDRILTLTDYNDHYGAVEVAKINFSLPLPDLLRKILWGQTMLFVGCSLAQDRTVAILRHVAGESPEVAHYAIAEVPRSKAHYHEKARHLSSLGIRPIWFPTGDYGAIEAVLAHLAEETGQNTGAGQIAPAAVGSGGQNVPPSALPAAVRPVTNAPSLPTNYLERDEELDSLRGLFLSEDAKRRVSITAVKGMGGVGKSILALALCHDELIQKNFHDGVIWVRVGQDPGNLAKQMFEIGQFFGDSPAFYETPEAGRNRLDSLIRGKFVLIVLDDVWDARQVSPFFFNSPTCRTLITTRDGRIALELEAEEVRLGTFSREQSIKLLRKWAKRDDPALASIAERLGDLPLAVRLAGAQLREGMTGAEWVETFQRVSQVRMGWASSTPQDNLQACFDLSAQSLPEADLFLYYSLGVFPEDLHVPQEVICRFWRHLRPELCAADCGELLRHMARIELLELTNKAALLHDLLRMYAREQLGAKLAEVQEALLSAYNPGGGPWSEVEDDGYIHAHLTWHMDDAGRPRQLHALLREETADGKNGWYAVRAGGGQTLGYLDDVSRAWHCAERADETALPGGLPLPEVSREVRCAIYRSSVRSLAADFPPEVLVALTRHRLWPRAQAVAYARQFSEAEQRVASLFLLAEDAGGPEARGILLEAYESLPLLPHYRGTVLRREITAALIQSGFHEDALRIVRETPLPSQQYSVEEMLQLTGDPNTLKALYGIASTYQDDDKLEVLAAMLPKAGLLNEDLGEEILRRLSGAAQSAGTSSAILKLIPAAEFLAGRQRQLLVSRLLDLLGNTNEGLVAEALPKLVPFLTDDLLGSALSVAESLLLVEDRVKAVVGVARKLPDAERVSALERLLAYIQKYEWPDDQAPALAALAAGWPEREHELYEMSLALAHEITVDYSLKEYLIKLAGTIPASLLHRVLELTEGIKSPTEREAALLGLAGARGTDDFLDAIRKVAAGVADLGQRVRLLTGIALERRGPARVHELKEALQLAGEIEAPYKRALAELEILPQLPSYEVDEHVYHRIFDCIGDAPPYEFASLTRTLIAQAPESVLERLLGFVFSLDNLEVRKDLLSRLAPRLARNNLRALMRLAGSVNDFDARARAARALEELKRRERVTPDEGTAAESENAVGLSRGPGSQPRREVSPDLLEYLFRNVPDDTGRRLQAQAFRVIGNEFARRGHFSQAVICIEQTRRGRSILHSEHGGTAYEAAVSDTAPLLPRAAISRLVESALSIKRPVPKAEFLHPLLEYLSSSERREAAEAVLKELNDHPESAMEWQRAKAMALLAEHLSAPRRQETARAAYDMAFEEPRAYSVLALTALAPHLDQEQLDAVLDFIESLPSSEEKYKAVGLLAVSPYSPDSVFKDALRRSWHWDKPERAETLASHIRRQRDDKRRELLVEQALGSAYSLSESSLRAESLLYVAIELEEPTRTKIMGDAFLAAMRETLTRSRDRTMSALITHLIFMPPRELYLKWQEALHVSSDRHRPELLADIKALRALLLHLGGDKAIEDTIVVLDEISRWWN